MRRDAARLLAEFSDRTIARLLSRLQTPSRDLVEVLLGGVSILLQEQDLRIVARRIAQERDDRARARMAHDVQLADRAIGKANPIPIDGDDLTRVLPLFVNEPWSDARCVAAHTSGWPRRSYS